MEERSYFAVKGGQGVTTLAVADAAEAAGAGHTVWLVTHDLPDTLSAAGMPGSEGAEGAEHFFVTWEPGDHPPRPFAVLTPATAARVRAFHAEDKATRFPVPDVIIHDLGVSPQADEMHGHKLLVTRPCYLALRRAVAEAPPVDGVVLVEEPERSLNRSDVEAVIGRPVVTTIPYDPAVARAVDSGLLSMRVPRSLAQALRQVVGAERVGGKP